MNGALAVEGYRLAPFCGREIQVDIGAPDGFVLGGGMLTAECGRMVPVSVDPLGGGEHGRRRCPARVLGQRVSSALYEELIASAGAKPKGVALRAYRGDCPTAG